ncbi:MAG: diguanylate cyclase [Pseudomonadota bacterium]|nr:diguanylate cyclase [Pseudomonadota bacterium]
MSRSLHPPLVLASDVPSDVSTVGMQTSAGPEQITLTLPETGERGVAALLQRLHPDDRERARRGLAQQGPADEPRPVAARLAGEDGAWHWLELIVSQSQPQLRLTGRVLKPGQPIGESLAEQLGQLELAQDLANIGYWRVDLRQGGITWSDNTYRIHGYQVGSFTPTLDGAIDMYHEDDRQAVREHVDAAIERGREFSFQARIGGLDGVCRAVAVRGRPLVDAAGDISALFGVVQDVSDYVAAESELRRQIDDHARLSRSLRRLHDLAATHHASATVQYRAYLQAGCELLGMSTGIVSHIRDEHYEIIALRSDNEVLREGQVFAVGETYCAEVLRVQGPVAMHAVGELPHMRSHPVYRSLALEAYIGAPILVFGEIYGTINFTDGARRGAPFTAAEIDMVSMMAHRLSTALEQAYHEQARQQAEISLREREALFKSAFEMAPVGMALIDLDHRFLRINDRLAQITTRHRGHLLGQRFDDLFPPAERARMQKGRAALLRGEQDRWEGRLPLDVTGLHTTRIWIDATLSLVRQDDGSPLYLVAQLQDVTARIEAETRVQEQAEALARANEELGRLVVTDPLTGLANRRALTERLDHEIARSSRSGAPLTVAVLDVDHFKRYNDDFGHLAGDGVLRQLAELLREQSRETDLAARYGGEEFVMLLNAAPAEAAAQWAERLQARIRAQAWPERAVTLSGGIVTLECEPMRGSGLRVTGETLIRAADQALYEAKRAGRDRVIAAPVIRCSCPG